jgi:hypothetical protein
VSVIVPDDTFVRRGVLLRTLDGDTFVALLDLGFYMQECPVRVRIHNLYAPEMDEPGGPEAKRYLSRLLGTKDLRLKTYKDQLSFDRWVADVWVKQASGWASVAERCIAAGHGTATK